MGIPERVRELLDGPHQKTRVAVVGATVEKWKFGWKIFQDLARKGFDVVPVNPRRTEVAGRRCYARVADVPDPLHIVDFVVPPDVAAQLVAEIPAGKTEVLWFQPGAFDAAVVQAAEKKATHVVAGPCIMVES